MSWLITMPGTNRSAKQNRIIGPPNSNSSLVRAKDQFEPRLFAGAPKACSPRLALPDSPDRLNANSSILSAKLMKRAIFQFEIDSFKQTKMPKHVREKRPALHHRILTRIHNQQPTFQGVTKTHRRTVATTDELT